MHYAYLVESSEYNNYIDNSAVFRLIQDLEINEDDIYIDTGDKKEELNRLLEIIGSEDRLVIRSVIDLSPADSKNLLAILQQLQENRVILCSIQESYLSGTVYYTAMRGFANIHIYYLQKRKEQGFKKAVESKTVGRPKQTEAIEKAIRLYNTKAFTTAEIEKLAGVSSSTLYRALKEVDKK